MTELIVVNNEDDTKETVHMKSGSTLVDVWNKVMWDKNPNDYLIRGWKDNEFVSCCENDLAKDYRKIMITLSEISLHCFAPNIPYGKDCIMCKISCCTRNTFERMEKSFANKARYFLCDEDASC